MKVISHDELLDRLNYARPLNPEAEASQSRSAWPIPFEYGSNTKGTRISRALARQIAAELLCAVAEADAAELRQALEDEKKRCEQITRDYSEASNERLNLRAHVAGLEKKLREERRRAKARR